MNAEQSTPQSLEATPSSSVAEITTPVPVHSLAFPDKILQMHVRDIEAIIDGLAGASLNLRPDDPVHFFDYVSIGKRKRAVFLLDKHVLVCESKRRYKSSSVSSTGTGRDSLRDSRFKLEQSIEIEKIDLRCQCWQNYHQHYGTSGSSNGGLLPSVTPTEHLLHNVISGNLNLRISSQLQATVSTESLATSIGCASCIETLEADVKTLAKLKLSANDMCSLPIRKLLKDNLHEIQDTVYRQLMSMHTTILNCSLDSNVDLYVVSPCVSHTLTDQNLVELLRLFDHNQSHHSSMKESENTPPQPVDITTIEAFENQTKFRLTHLRCPQHQPNALATLPSTPLISLTFSCSKKRAYFETVLLCLRAKLFKSKLVLNSVCSMPYEKTRLTLQFRCAGAALGTNNIWICTSDRGQAQISVLVLSSNSEIEHSIVSCNTVATSQISTISSVPGTEYFDGTGSALMESLIANLNNSQAAGNNNNSASEGSTTKTGSKSQDGERIPEKMRSNSIQVPAFFHTLKSGKSNNSNQQRHSRHFLDRDLTILSPSLPVPPPPSRESSSSNLQNSPGNNETGSGTNNNNASSLSYSNSNTSNDSNGNRNCPTKHPTMWFATADQQLSIYSCLDNIRTGKHKMKIGVDAAVEAIQYYCDRVFVALSNSTVAIFQRGKF